MEFFEFLVAFGVAVVMPVLIVKLVIDYRKAQLNAGKAAGPDNAIRVSELKGMMREVAQEELAPFKDRVEWIEDRLEMTKAKPDRLASPEDRQLLAEGGVKHDT